MIFDFELIQIHPSTFSFNILASSLSHFRYFFQLWFYRFADLTILYRLPLSHLLPYSLIYLQPSITFLAVKNRGIQKFGEFKPLILFQAEKFCHKQFSIICNVLIYSIIQHYRSYIHLCHNWFIAVALTGTYFALALILAYKTGALNVLIGRVRRLCSCCQGNRKNGQKSETEALNQAHAVPSNSNSGSSRFSKGTTNNTERKIVVYLFLYFCVLFLIVTMAIGARAFIFLCIQSLKT